jgi:hypothetical protein
MRPLSTRRRPTTTRNAPRLRRSSTSSRSTSNNNLLNNNDLAEAADSWASCKASFRARWDREVEWAEWEWAAVAGMVSSPTGTAAGIRNKDMVDILSKAMEVTEVA